ncbi:MAG: DUF6497 family protein [Tateyamaria sp.]|uniref:DUF6497 family protein n=1 Tax=Tateyamaria sp. TaxID=1929288 RepID=UPI00329DB042
MVGYCRIQTNRTVRWPSIARTAASEGGALRWKQRWVRGCTLLFLMASPALAQDVPSGQSVTLNEVLIDEVNAESWLRFRFLAPQIARETGDITYTAAEEDFAHLCETVARPYLVEFDLTPQVVVITLMDRPVPFGQADPEATQFIEAFRILDETCRWEAF